MTYVWIGAALGVVTFAALWLVFVRVKQFDRAYYDHQPEDE